MSGQPRSTKAPLPEERRSTEWAYGLLRDRILSGEMRPGSTVSQARLAEDLGISRTPLREATRLLQNEGLLEGEPNRRLRVAGLSVADLEQVYAMRIATECLALRTAVPLMDADHIGQIASSMEAMESAAMAADMNAADTSHHSFHRLLVAPAGERFERLAQTLWDHSGRYRGAYVASGDSWVDLMFKAQADHAGILSAVSQGDAAQAAFLLASHYSRTALALLQITDPDHSPDLLGLALLAVEEHTGS